jgi:hypothetical protein
MRRLALRVSRPFSLMGELVIERRLCCRSRPSPPTLLPATVFPNAPIVVPGLVKHTIEFRDLSEETLVRLRDAAKKRAQEIAAETGTEITITQIEHLRPACGG